MRRAWLALRAKRRHDRRFVMMRAYCSDDLVAAANLFTESVHGLGAAHYEPAQLLAWAPKPPDLEHWRRRFEAMHVLLTEDDDRLVGMIGYHDDGHVDLLFTHPTAARRGIARSLQEEVERRLAARGVYELFTEASEAARPFFARCGYQVEEREVVHVRGVALHRYRMRK